MIYQKQAGVPRFECLEFGRMNAQICMSLQQRKRSIKR